MGGVFMGLKLKTLSEILNDMITWVSTNTKKVTDFNVGSAVRTLLESVSLQLEEFYYKMYENIMWAIENSLFTAFGFELKKATAADGYVLVTFKSEMTRVFTIQKNTEFSTPKGITKPKYYYVTKDIIVPIGAKEVLVPVRCTELGESGNVPADTITLMVTPHSSIQSVTNPHGFITGRNAETKSERKQRFLKYIQTLARGTSDAIAYGCMDVDGVQGVWIDDSDIGLVRAYVHDFNGDLPSDLKLRVQENVKNYKAAGVEVAILPVVKRTIDLNITLIINNDYDTKLYSDVVENEVYRFLNSFQVSKNLYLSELIQYIMNLYEDVIVSVKINNLKNDLSITNRELIKPGDITIDAVNIKDWVW